MTLNMAFSAWHDHDYDYGYMTINSDVTEVTDWPSDKTPLKTKESYLKHKTPPHQKTGLKHKPNVLTTRGTSRRSRST